MNRSLGVTEWILAVLPSWSVSFFELLSLFGDLFVIVAVVGLVSLIDVIQSVQRQGDRATAPLCSDRTSMLIATVFGGLALIVALEAVFTAPRPPADWHAIVPSEYGFPSGHTMAALILWGALAQWMTVGRRQTRYVAVAGIVALVGVSRLALGVHYLVDVVAAVGFGLVYLLVVRRVMSGSPSRGFVIAVAISVVAVGVSAGSSRGLLALGGTVGAAVGWWVIEQPAVKQLVFRFV